MKQEALIRQFENENEAYNKIRKTAEEKVNSILSNRKELLGRAIFCVIESIRIDPGKYSPLIYHNDDTTSTSSIPTTTIAEYYNRQYYPSYTYGVQQQQQYFSSKDSFKQAYTSMPLEETERLYTSLEKTIVDATIDEYAKHQ